MADPAKSRVLVVDDAALARMFYREVFGRAGYEVDEALNGLEALEKLMATPVDLLVVDVNMPRMDGFSFLKALRRQDLPLAGIPAMVVTTEAGPQDREAARAAGANFYLLKPASPESLVAFADMMSGRRP